MNKNGKFPIDLSTQVPPDEKKLRLGAASDQSDRRSYYAARSPLSQSIRIVNPLQDFSEQIGAIFG
jgi:hypothetical protein